MVRKKSKQRYDINFGGVGGWKIGMLLGNNRNIFECHLLQCHAKEVLLQGRYYFSCCVLTTTYKHLFQHQCQAKQNPGCTSQHVPKRKRKNNFFLIFVAFHLIIEPPTSFFFYVHAVAPAVFFEGLFFFVFFFCLSKLVKNTIQHFISVVCRQHLIKT